MQLGFTLKRLGTYTLCATFGSLALFWVAKKDVDRRRGELVRVQKRMQDSQFIQEILPVSDIVTLTESEGFETRLKEAETST